MLENTRRQASIFVYIIFGLLIVIFIYGINPGNRGGGDGGCSVNSNSVVTVNGATAGEGAYRIAYSMSQGQARQRTYLTLDRIIYRELLAQAAEERGIRTTGDLIDDEIKNHHGYFYLGGERIDVSSQFFEDGFYKHRRWLDWVAARNMQSPAAYKDQQSRELQAALMADVITHSVRVSRDEALQSYLYDNNTVTYDVVAFDPARYRRAMRLTDADTKRYLDAHAAEVEARYKADERTYKGVKPQLGLREIFIPRAAPEAAKPDDKAAKPDDKAAKPDDKAAKPDDKAAKPGDKTAKAAKPGDKATADRTAKAAKPGDKAAADKTAKADDKVAAAGEAAKPYGLPVEAAKAKLEALRAEIAAGKLTFPDAEKQVAADASDDAPTENGDRGWQPVEKPGLGDKAVNDAIKVLKPGEMTPVTVTERGVYLVMATGKREGDLSFDQVKLEIASGLARDAWSKEAAKRAALEAIAQVQAGKGLDQMFEKEQAPPRGGGIEQLLQDPNLTQEQKQKILEQLMQQQQKHGSLSVHEEDVPAAWYADADGSAKADGAAKASAAGSAAPAEAGSAAPAAGSAAPAAGSAGPAAPAAAAPAAPAPDIVASTDQLPQFGPVDKPKVARLGPTPRETKLPGVGASKAAIDALFDELSPGSVAKKIYEGDNGAYVAVQLVNRAQPKVEEFDKTADAEIARMQEARGKAALYGWLRSRCEALTKANRIRPAPDRIRETDDKGNPAPTVYRPCMTLDFFDR